MGIQKKPNVQAIDEESDEDGEYGTKPKMGNPRPLTTMSDLQDNVESTIQVADQDNKPTTSFMEQTNDLHIKDNASFQSSNKKVELKGKLASGNVQITTKEDVNGSQSTQVQNTKTQVRSKSLFV